MGSLVGGKYEILRRLGCGGMGSVYEARHAVVGRHFAVKFLHHQFAQQRTMVQRFLQEARATGSLSSEHLIGVIDYGTHDRSPYLVMELIVGQDLKALISETPRLPIGRAVRIVLDACRGLAVAHARGLIHRDLKPANIFLSRSSEDREVAKVIDFGVAKLRDSNELSDEGAMIGTIGYMAPEQLTGDDEVDVRADVYALGVILYQALSGRLPHACSRSQMLFRIVAVDPDPLHSLRPDVPQGLAEEVHRALHRRRERRHESVEALARALEPFALLDDVAPVDAGAAAPDDSGLGNAATEPSNSPGWAASTLSSAASASSRGASTPSASACSSARSASSAPCRHPSTRPSLEEGYCRYPAGVDPAPPTTGHGEQMSQRAVMLSLGALALSVVAIAMMFAFVYSQGAAALRAGPVQPGEGAAASPGNRASSAETSERASALQRTALEEPTAGPAGVETEARALTPRTDEPGASPGR